MQIRRFQINYRDLAGNHIQLRINRELCIMSAQATSESHQACEGWMQIFTHTPPCMFIITIIYFDVKVKDNGSMDCWRDKWIETEELKTSARSELDEDGANKEQENVKFSKISNKPKEREKEFKGRTAKMRI